MHVVSQNVFLVVAELLQADRTTSDVQKVAISLISMLFFISNKNIVNDEKTISILFEDRFLLSSALIV